MPILACCWNVRSMRAPRPFSSRAVLGLAAAIVTLAVAGSVAAVAQVVPSDDAIVACVANQNGATRIVSSAADCKKSERSVGWNVRGPAGPAGPAGIGGVRIVGVDRTSVDPIIVLCHDDETVVGGGANASPSQAALSMSVPLANGSGWLASARWMDADLRGEPIQMQVFAICASTAGS